MEDDKLFFCMIYSLKKLLDITQLMQGNKLSNAG